MLYVFKWCIYATYPQFKLKQTSSKLENKLSLLSQSHFLSFTLARPFLLMLTRCARHRTPCRLQRALPLWDRWGAGFCRSAWLEIRNALLLHLLILCHYLLLCLLLPFLIAHTKLTRRSVTAPSRDHEKTATNFPRGAGLWAQMLCICALSVCACRNGICAICNDRQSHVPVRWKCHSMSTDIFGLANKKQSLYYFYFIHQPVRKHWCNLNRFTDKWMALHHENVLMHKLVKRLRFENDEKTFLPFWYFYYFLFMRTLFLPFRFASLPQFSLFTALSLGFSWKRSVFSTRILWLCNRVLRHKTLQQHWRRRRDGTDKQGHKASQTGRECVCVDS